MPGWVKPITKEQANPPCGCVWDILGMYLLYVCPKHARKPKRRKRKGGR